MQPKNLMSFIFWSQPQLYSKKEEIVQDFTGFSSLNFVYFERLLLLMISFHLVLLVLQILTSLKTKLHKNLDLLDLLQRLKVSTKQIIKKPRLLSFQKKKKAIIHDKDNLLNRIGLKWVRFLKNKYDLTKNRWIIDGLCLLVRVQRAEVSAFGCNTKKCKIYMAVCSSKKSADERGERRPDWIKKNKKLSTVGQLTMYNGDRFEKFRATNWSGWVATAVVG